MWLDVTISTLDWIMVPMMLSLSFTTLPMYKNNVLQVLLNFCISNRHKKLLKVYSIHLSIPNPNNPNTPWFLLCALRYKMNIQKPCFVLIDVLKNKKIYQKTNYVVVIHHNSINTNTHVHLLSTVMHKSNPLQTQLCSRAFPCLLNYSAGWGVFYIVMLYNHLYSIWCWMYDLHGAPEVNMKNESLHREQKYECLSETGFFFLEWTIRIKQAVQVGFFGRYKEK